MEFFFYLYMFLYENQKREGFPSVMSTQDFPPMLFRFFLILALAIFLLYVIIDL